MKKSNLIVGDMQKCQDPVLSILIPTYGRAEYLEEAIDSAIHQKTNICYEVIVCSNDPTDSLERIKRKYMGVDNFYLYQNEENIGMVGNSNRLALLARGRYIAYLHDDDFLLPGYLEYIEELLRKNSELKCYITGRNYLYDNYSYSYSRAKTKNRLRKFLFVSWMFKSRIKKISVKDNLYSSTNCYMSPSCGTLIEKNAFDIIGGFDEDIPYSWDWDFFLRLNLRYPVYADYESHAVYRLGANASIRKEVKYDFYSYHRTIFLEFMKKNKIGVKFIKRNQNEIIGTMYCQWKNELDEVLISKNEEIPKINNLKQKLFKIKTTLYFYMHNLDFFKPIIRNDK